MYKPPSTVLAVPVRGLLVAQDEMVSFYYLTLYYLTLHCIFSERRGYQKHQVSIRKGTIWKLCSPKSVKSRLTDGILVKTVNSGHPEEYTAFSSELQHPHRQRNMGAPGPQLHTHRSAAPAPAGR